MLDVHQVLSESTQSFPFSENRQSKLPAIKAKIYVFLKNAETLIKHGEMVLAANLLRQACNIEPTNEVVLDKLAALLEGQNNYSEAIILRRQLMRQNYCFETIYKAAEVTYKMENDEQALQLYYEALSLIDDTRIELFEIYKNLGNIYVRSGDFESAEENYNKAYRLNPRSDVLLVNFGTLEVQRGDLENALLRFRRAIELNKLNDRAWAGLALVHNEYGDFELAFGNLASAIDLNPLNRTALFIGGQWAARDGEPAKIIPALQHYLSETGFDLEINFTLINLLCLSGQMRAALVEVERILAYSPGNVEALKVREQIEISLGK